MLYHENYTWYTKLNFDINDKKLLFIFLNRSNFSSFEGLNFTEPETWACFLKVGLKYSPYYLFWDGS